MGGILEQGDFLLVQGQIHWLGIGVVNVFIDIGGVEGIAHAALTGEHRARCELVATGVGFSIGAKLPNATDEQYGFRNLVIPGKEYHVLSVHTPLREQKLEVRRYLELLDETLEDIRLR